MLTNNIRKALGFILLSLLILRFLLSEVSQSLWSRLHGLLAFFATQKYDPKKYWEQRGQTFISEEYQRGLYWQHDWMLNKLRSLQPLTILEVGCGFGRNLRFLAQNLSETTQFIGADLSWSMLRHAQQFLKGLPVSLLNADVLALPFSDESFDAVVVHGLFMHIPPAKVDAAIREVKRVARRYVLVCEQNFSGHRPDRHGVVQINDYTFSYDYARRFNNAGFFILEQRSVKDLDAFLLQKRGAKYDVPHYLDPSRLPKDASHVQVVNLVPPRSHILDVGCSTGYLGHYLIEEKDCVVDGLEIDSKAVAKAARYYQQVFVGSADDPETLAQIKGPYDVVLLAAILEHLVHPERTLQAVHRWLAPDGFAIVSLPNIAHWSVRWELLRGRFEYRDYGILDRTHLRFFTQEAARDFLQDAGFKIEYFNVSTMNPSSLDGVLLKIPRVGYRIRRWLATQFPGLLGVEMIFKIVPNKRTDS